MLGNAAGVIGMRIFMVGLAVEMSCLFALIVGYSCLSVLQITGVWMCMTYLPALKASAALHFVRIYLYHVIIAC